jgi:prepilin-type N-terminal cleavage/methylation domain-containing protein
MHRSPSPTAPRGFSLLECMVALTLLAIGIISLMRLQVFALYSDHDARANVRAQELAREMLSGFLRIDPSDAMLAANYTGTVPTTFADPLDASTATYWTTYTTQSLPGVTSTAEIDLDPLDATKPLYVRKWSVWQLANANTASGVKLVAVSVVYHGGGTARPRAVTLYGQVSNPGAAAVNAAAYR